VVTIRKTLFAVINISICCWFALILSSFLPNLVLAEDKELSERAKKNDANRDGFIQKNEAKYHVKANFNAIDCDKNSALDGVEIKRFLDGKGCGDQVSGANIYHEKKYPKGTGPFPAIISLHSSGGFTGTRELIENFRSETWLKAGYAWYAPNFFAKHGITTRTRMNTFVKYREDIEKELAEIITLMKADPKIDSKNIFAIGFSNGGFWASFLAGKGIVTAAASHYGVWRACKGRCENFYPVKYFSSNSSPFLALHGADDSTQKIKYFYDAWDRIKGTPGIEKYVYDAAGHVWDCFPSYPKLKKICTKKFDGPNRDVTNDALKRTLTFFKTHSN
jgi:dienelactone hydrolase